MNLSMYRLEQNQVKNNADSTIKIVCKKVANQLSLKVVLDGLIDYIAFLKMMETVYINKNNSILSPLRREIRKNNQLSRIKIREDISKIFRGPFILAHLVYLYMYRQIDKFIGCLKILNYFVIYSRHELSHGNPIQRDLTNFDRIMSEYFGFGKTLLDSFVLTMNT